MKSFSIGLSAIRTSQVALESVSNNIANANTEGYHRRRVHLKTLTPDQIAGFRVGTGVGVDHIERIRNSVTETSLTNIISDVSHVEQILTIERQIEAAFISGGNSVASELDSFFSEMTQLTAAPDEPAQRLALIESGQRLTELIQHGASELRELSLSIRFQMQQEVEALNEDMVVLTKLSAQIRDTQASGHDAGIELDQRDALLNRIADVVDIRRNDYVANDLNLMVGNASIQQSGKATQFEVLDLADNQVGISLNGIDEPIELGTGRLSALAELYNETIPKYQKMLNDLAVGLMQNIDAVHATGIGPAGSFERLIGRRPVDDISAPLVEAGTLYPLESGELSISLIDENGDRRTEKVSINPFTDSLEDVAVKLSAIDGFRATVNTQSKTLNFFAETGTLFDFTRNVQTHPDLTALSGTSEPSFSGAFEGSQNEELTFRIEGSGEVGISEGLFLVAIDEDGNTRDRVNIGNGYEAGTPIDLGYGIDVSLSFGTVSDGDEFQMQFVSEPDETGLLAALGLNSFFRGINADTIGIDPDLENDSDRLASGRSNDIADTHNLFKMLDAELSATLPGNLTLSEFAIEINTEIGFQINTNVALSGTLQTLHSQIEQDRDAYSGVDLNEEMVHLQQFQKSYEAAVRIIQTADRMLTEMFSIIG